MLESRDGFKSDECYYKASKRTKNETAEVEARQWIAEQFCKGKGTPGDLKTLMNGGVGYLAYHFKGGEINGKMKKVLDETPETQVETPNEEKIA